MEQSAGGISVPADLTWFIPRGRDIRCLRQCQGLCRTCVNTTECDSQVMDAALAYNGIHPLVQLGCCIHLLRGEHTPRFHDKLFKAVEEWQVKIFIGVVLFDNDNESEALLNWTKL